MRRRVNLLQRVGRYIKSSGDVVHSQSVISIMCGGIAVDCGVCGRAGNSIEAVASYVVNQTVGVCGGKSINSFRREYPQWVAV
jgi:hypothetical protein